MRRLWHWFTNQESWRCKYLDGTRTVRLTRSQAHVMKYLHGGKVVFDPWKAKE